MNRNTLNDQAIALQRSGARKETTIHVGIAIRRGDALVAQVQKAVNSMYADGAMKKILAKWKMSATALKK